MEQINNNLLDTRNLSVGFRSGEKCNIAVDNISFYIEKGETLGMVGESGCGKSVTALSVLRLVACPPGQILGGEILFQGQDLLKLSKKEMRRIRGNRISMIFQEPLTSLNPVFTVGDQIAEAIQLHQKVNKKEAFRRAVEMFQKVGIARPEKRIQEYPHRLSGGMRQRVMIAMALASNPLLLMADEPTTALDVTIQAQILDLMKNLQEQMGTSILMITHDLGVIAETTKRVLVMYAGRIVEEAPVEFIFSDPLHPYTEGLLKSLPKIGRRDRLSIIPGVVPELNNLPKGCRFHPRCPYRKEICSETEPPRTQKGENRWVSCWQRI